MFIEPMQRIGSSVAGFLSGYKHIVFSKDIKQSISSDFEIGLVKFIIQ
jgi:hypothetical protein